MGSQPIRIQLRKILWEILAGKTLQKHFYLVEEVLSFDLVGHMSKLVKNRLQE